VTGTRHAICSWPHASGRPATACRHRRVPSRAHATPAPAIEATSAGRIRTSPKSATSIRASKSLPATCAPDRVAGGGRAPIVAAERALSSATTASSSSARSGARAAYGPAISSRRRTASKESGVDSRVSVGVQSRPLLRGDRQVPRWAAGRGHVEVNGDVGSPSRNTTFSGKFEVGHDSTDDADAHTTLETRRPANMIERGRPARSSRGARRQVADTRRTDFRSRTRVEHRATEGSGSVGPISPDRSRTVANTHAGPQQFARLAPTKDRPRDPARSPRSLYPWPWPV
jgi:hypothetical protein